MSPIGFRIFSDIIIVTAYQFLKYLEPPGQYQLNEKWLNNDGWIHLSGFNFFKMKGNPL